MLAYSLYEKELSRYHWNNVSVYIYHDEPAGWSSQVDICSFLSENMIHIKVSLQTQFLNTTNLTTFMNLI